MVAGLREGQVRGLPRQRRDEVFADEYGVRADGTDQTSALTRALAAAATQGKALVIPPGTYTCLDVVMPAGTVLRGFGPSSILRRPSTGPGGLSNCLRIGGSNIRVSDLTLDGNKAGGSLADGRGVIDMGATVNYSNILVERCTIINASELGVRMRSLLSGGRVKDCFFNEFRTGVFITAGSGAGADVFDSVVTGCHLVSTVSNASGIMMRGTDDGVTRFSNRTLVSDNTVIVPLGGSGLCIEVWARDCVISDNICIGGAFGISRGFGEGGTITGNTIRGPTGYGIEASSGGTAKFVSVVGNTIMGEHVTGFGIGAQACDWVKINDNTIVYPSNRGITVGNCGNCTIVGNTVLSDATTDTVGYGIYAAAPMTEAVINDNLVDGTTPNAGISDNGIIVENVPDFTIVGNRVKNHTNGIRLISSAVAMEGTIVGNHVGGNTDSYLESLSGGGTTTNVVFGSNRPTIP